MYHALYLDICDEPDQSASLVRPAAAACGGVGSFTVAIPLSRRRGVVCAQHEDPSLETDCLGARSAPDPTSLFGRQHEMAAIRRGGELAARVSHERPCSAARTMGWITPAASPAVKVMGLCCIHEKPKRRLAGVRREQGQELRAGVVGHPKPARTAAAQCSGS